MNNRLKYIISTVLVVSVISAVTFAYVYNQDTTEPYTKTSNLSANSLTFHDVDQLDDYVELVVVGYATEDFMEREHKITAYEDGLLQDFSTRTHIKIDQILKKPADFPENQTDLTIIEPVSLHEGAKITADNYIELQKNESNVIFLIRNSSGDFSLANDNLGKILLTDNEPEAPLQALTRTELSEYDEFRDTVLKKYGLNE